MSDLFEDLIERLAKFKADGVADEDISHAVRVLLEKLDMHESLDHDFIELLHTIADGDNAELHKINKYANIAQSLDQDSTVIYFKSAGLFRVYQSTDLEHYFVNRAKTNYRGQRAIYEVVNDDRPQKIVIIIDSRDKTELSKIKQYILDFSKEIDVEMSAEDLIVFDNSSDDTYEIVVKSWIVSDANDKNTRIQKLLQYIAREEKSAILSNKMTKMNYSDIPNTSMITAPGIKKLLSPFAKELDGFVSNTSGNVYIVINNGTIVNGDNTTNNFNATPDVGDDFIQYLESAEFDWYEPGKTVEYEMLYAEYVSNIKNISRRRFTGLYKGVLFSKITKTTLNNEYVRYVTFI